MIKSLIIILLLLALGALILLVALRLRDSHADAALAERLESASAEPPPRFSAAMLEGLPEPAARFFRFAVQPGTPLKTRAVITMSGTLALSGDGSEQTMRARQVLAPPHGLIWPVRLSGLPFVTGTDAFAGGESWSRFRVFDLVPVGRISEDADHRRSSFGRMVGEGLFWTPAAFLPAAEVGWDRIEWRAVGDNSAAVTVEKDGLVQEARIDLAADGRPLRAVFPRWSNENPERIYRRQPFGGDLSEFRNFEGFRLPTMVTGGNHYGTPEYFPFFKARVENVTFL